MSNSPSFKPDNASHPASGAEHPERSWAASISGQQPAFAWAVAAILGVVAISAAPRVTIIRLLLPVSVMFIYVWLTYPRDSSAAPGLRATRIAQLADSAYFLGFLWTLWALIDSFVLKGATGAEVAFRVFGYALVTTFAGTLTRLYLLQFKYGAGEQAAEAEVTVERNLQIFSAAMQDASQSIQSFQVFADALNRNVEQLSKTLETLDREFANSHKETTKAIKENIANTVEEIRGTLKAPIQEYGRAIRGFTANVDRESELLIKTVQNSAAQVSQAVKDSTGKADRILQDTGQRMALGYLELATRLQNEAGRIVENLREVSQKLGSINLPIDGLKKVADCFSGLEGALVNLGRMLGPEGPVRVELSNFAVEIKVQTDALKKAIAEIVGRLQSIEVPAEVSIEISALTRSITELQTAVEELLRKAGDQRWEKAPQSASDAILKLTASVNNLRHAVDSTETSVKKTVAPSPGPRKSRFWPW
jgi:archaellum component FlaC